MIATKFVSNTYKMPNFLFIFRCKLIKYLYMIDRFSQVLMNVYRHNIAQTQLSHITT